MHIYFFFFSFFFLRLKPQGLSFGLLQFDTDLLLLVRMIALQHQNDLINNGQDWSRAAFIWQRFIASTGVKLEQFSRLWPTFLQQNYLHLMRNKLQNLYGHSSKVRIIIMTILLVIIDGLATFGRQIKFYKRVKMLKVRLIYKLRIFYPRFL